MATVTADYQDRKRIVFTARGRATTNVREMVADGPAGYSSTELLLIAVGNCSLGAFLNHDLLKDANVTACRSTLEAAMVPNPTRIEQIFNRIELEVTDEALLAQHEVLEAASCECPLCNTLGDKIITTLTITLAKTPVAV